ncbi:hypothetical protein Pelo_18489 [Pelomyxa schiedti]|nr:hypothetical protein Pelo_18489 [Pelomyxa schiedti]
MVCNNSAEFTVLPVVNREWVKGKCSYDLVFVISFCTSAVVITHAERCTHDCSLQLRYVGAAGWTHPASSRGLNAHSIKWKSVGPLCFSTIPLLLVNLWFVRTIARRHALSEMCASVPRLS